MRWPSIAAITVAVTAVHGWVMLDPWQWMQGPRIAPLAMPTSVEVALLLPPAPPPPPRPSSPQPPTAAAKPVSAPAKAPRPPKPQPPRAPKLAAAVPQPVAPVTPLAETEFAPPPAVPPTSASAEPIPVAPSEPQDESAPAADSTPALPAITPAAHPAPDTLQVLNAQGQPYRLVLPTDGSTLSQNMELRFQVHGFVKGMEYHAHAVLQWQTQGNSYSAYQSISAFLLGSLEQRSEGHIGPQGLQPVRFEDSRLTKRRHVDFVWERGHALFEPVRDPAPIGAGTQDRLSVFLQLASMLNAIPSLREAGTQIAIPTMGSRRLQTWQFQVQAFETLDLPAGSIQSLRLQRLPQPGDEEQTDIWLAPDMGFVPVRIRMQERNGDHLDLTLKSSR